jgi:hypothetical protein
LEGLASRYADLFNTHYGDVLEHLEDLRRREWEEMSPRIRVLVGTTPGTPPSEAYSPITSGPVGGVIGHHTSQVSEIDWTVYGLTLRLPEIRHFRNGFLKCKWCET